MYLTKYSNYKKRNYFLEFSGRGVRGDDDHDDGQSDDDHDDGQSDDGHDVRSDDGQSGGVLHELPMQS